jgi:hypothetical protein
VGQGKKYYTHLKQVAKYSDKITWGYWPTRKATTPFKAWNCIITDEILDNIVQHTNQYIPIMQPNFSREIDTKLTDKIEIKAFIALLYLAGALWSSKQSLEELWRTDKDGVKNCA